jgi:hypothetical protein
MAKIRGIPVEMGGAEWIVPPLTLGQIRACKADRKVVTGNGEDDIQFVAAARIILPALQRNYPDVTMKELEDELLDAGNLSEVLRAVLSGSGLRPAVSGEAMAARIGSASTDSSPLPVDTGPETSTN